jgi:hypothetical protein
LECVSGDASFLIGVRGAKNKGPWSWREGALWVPTVASGERLLAALRRAWGARPGKARARSRLKAPTILAVTVLGSKVGESGSRKGTWTRTKWTGSEDVPEFYVRWSTDEKRGVLTEKDESYRRALFALFRSISGRP